MTPDTAPEAALAAVLLFTVRPTDRALAGEDWLTEELNELGLRERIA